ncbi:MAG: OmpA family protein, partial [Pseudorhodobacter sp.]
YKEASQLADRGDLRVLNGLYLTSWQLGQREAAQDAFGKLVASGLEAKRLPMKLLFKPGTVSFNDVGDLPTQYQLWLATMAREAGKTPACMKVVGHTSRTGSASVNERLSLRRAEAVSKLLEGRDRSLRARLSVGGVGSREALIGLGTDDQRDALDRRVEFRVVDCI